MALRFISSGAAPEDFERALKETRDTDDEVVLKVDGKLVGMVVPLSQRALNEELREAFSTFWEEHKAYQRETPPDVTEDEAMELAVDLVRQARRELRAEREAANHEAANHEAANREAAETSSSDAA